MHFAQAEDLTVAREFVEVETGKGSEALDRRSQIKAAFSQPVCPNGYIQHPISNGSKVA
jgi:hypothetical protein